MLKTPNIYQNFYRILICNTININNNLPNNNKRFHIHTTHKLKHIIYYVTDKKN